MKKTHSPRLPTAVWSGHDLLEGRSVDSVTIIFYTVGCYWGNREGCTMCGYVNDSSPDPVYEDELLAQFELAAEKIGPSTSLLKIFTSGSFFDDREVPASTRSRILERITRFGTVRKVIIETRPEFVNEKVLSDAMDVLGAGGITLEIAMGLETSSDAIRKECIHKGFTFKDFVKASEKAKSMGITTKAYLLLKPPFLSEKLAVDDIIASISDTSSYASTISLNLCNVQKGTLVEELFERNDYRPPWLWSAVFILKNAKKMFPHIILMSDPVGAGSKRGPHNCRKCDKDVTQSLRDFSISQNTDVLTEVDCDCYPLWEKIIELEDYTFGSILIK